SAAARRQARRMMGSGCGRGVREEYRRVAARVESRLRGESHAWRPARVAPAGRGRHDSCPSARAHPNASEPIMSVKTPRELLKHELGDILYAEKQVLKALKPMIRETSDPEMKARLEQHEQETEAQIGNVERAFEAIGEKARAQKCPGIL